MGPLGQVFRTHELHPSTMLKLFDFVIPCCFTVYWIISLTQEGSSTAERRSTAKMKCNSLRRDKTMSTGSERSCSWRESSFSFSEILHKWNYAALGLHLNKLLKNPNGSKQVSHPRFISKNVIICYGLLCFETTDWQCKSQIRGSARTLTYLLLCFRYLLHPKPS